MILQQNTPTTQTNAQNLGEFQIRNSAKSFQILSSGLYSNKIRAVIRELSTNAVDSHRAASNPNPFEVHLPCTLEPWFAVRDFGVGLSHDEVVNLYTTYFESTKTTSNDYVGALGLGSKSPFSYVDNFTITTVKAGRKGIYTAYINDQGIPSIVLMGEDLNTSDAPGVEVKFAVDLRNDFWRFKTEAQEIYQWFDLQPVFTGEELAVTKTPVIHTDLIPGIDVMDRKNSSLAVMGNIAYPMDILTLRQHLGELADLLGCGLVIKFPIGALDFQASREGLSYIPQTIDAIRERLLALQTALSGIFIRDLDQISNLWEKAYLVQSRMSHTLWSKIALKFLADNQKDPFWGKIDSYYGEGGIPLKLDNLNIKVRTIYLYNGKWTARVAHQTDRIPVSKAIGFVINATKNSGAERVKAHFNTTNSQYRQLFLIEPLDKTQPMRLTEFWAQLFEPPQSQRIEFTTLNALPTRPRAETTGIWEMTFRRNRRFRSSSVSRDVTWKSGSALGAYSTSDTHYYVALQGMKPLFATPIGDVKNLVYRLSDTKLLGTNFVLKGVSSKLLPEVKKLQNWKPLEDTIIDLLKTQSRDAALVQFMDNGSDYHLKSVIRKLGIDTKSQNPLVKLCRELNDSKHTNVDYYTINYLKTVFGDQNVNLTQEIQTMYTEIVKLLKNYPMLRGGVDSLETNVLLDYITLVDTATKS